MGLSVCNLREVWLDLTDVTLADEDTNASDATSCPNFEQMPIMVAQFATYATGFF